MPAVLAKRRAAALDMTTGLHSPGRCAKFLTLLGAYLIWVDSSRSDSAAKLGKTDALNLRQLGRPLDWVTSIYF
jgi:hypothetical protein